MVWLLIAVSSLNAFYTVMRSRKYRLFEVNVEQAGPSTPSAHRVRVDSSPAAASPLRFFRDMIGAETAETRAHPDSTRDVWEMAIWDPFPATLRISCLFSPGHILVYMLFLPLTIDDPRPKITVFKCLVLQVIFSAQLLLLQTRFSQQHKDTAILQKEVMHEYDTKYVHPRLHPVYRDATTQITMGEDGIQDESITVGTPTTVLRRGFKTNPNPNYTKHFDPENAVPAQPRIAMSPALFTPLSKSTGRTRIRQSLPPSSPAFQHVASTAVSTGTSTAGVASPGDASHLGPGYGGLMGVYTHANSPLKKATSMGDLKAPVPFSPRNSREMAALEQRETAERMVGQSSPLKDSRRATTQFGSAQTQWGRPRFSQERFPSLR
jgi:hypothetical protein